MELLTFKLLIHSKAEPIALLLGFCYADEAH